jgi:hypothetical protein
LDVSVLADDDSVFVVDSEGEEEDLLVSFSFSVAFFRSAEG